MKKIVLFFLLIQCQFLFPSVQISDESYLTGQFNPSKDSRFMKLKEGYFIRKDVYQAFLIMSQAAKKDGISLQILSALRTFQSQKGIWNEKWEGKRLVSNQDLSKTVPDPIERSKIILKYSSMPGTSRHHWGTDIDLNSLNPEFFLQPKGKKIYQWLKTNGPKYGFCQPYTELNSERKTGYQEEKWHWSYYPVSKELLKKYLQIITYNQIKGFYGDETASHLQVIKNYVESINSQCK